jgi:TonB family protein
MLMKNKQGSSGILKYLLVIPIITGLVWFTACTDEAGPDQDMWMTDRPPKIQEKPKSSVSLYAENIIYSEYTELNKWEKQIKVAAVEFNETGASKEEVIEFVRERISHLVNEVPDAIESSELLKSMNIGYSTLKNDYTMFKTNAGVIIDVSPQDAETFFIVEEMPEFDGGGLEEFRNWVQTEVAYPDIALQNGISGTVYVNFIVDKSGVINHVEIVRGVDPSLDNEVIRVIKQSPQWKPGVQRGKNVNVTMSIPVKFMLQ